MKKTDLSFKNSHDENGIPICCMTCEKWSFSGGKACGVNDYTIPCPKWEISIYYANKKEDKHEPILSKADGES